MLHGSSGSVLGVRELGGRAWHATGCRDTNCHAQVSPSVMAEPLKGQPAVIWLLLHSSAGQGTLLVPRIWRHRAAKHTMRGSTSGLTSSSLSAAGARVRMHRATARAEVKIQKSRPISLENQHAPTPDNPWIYWRDSSIGILCSSCSSLGLLVLEAALMS